MRRRVWATVVAAAVASTAMAVPAAAGPTGGALPPPLTLVLPVAGVRGIPVDAVGVAMNVTVTNPAGSGFLTVYPCGDRPTVSNLNYTLDQTVPNLVIAALDADGDVCIDTLTTTDIVVDVAGYLPAGSSITPLAQPVRFLDTRDGTGAPKRRVVGGEVLSVPVAGRFGVPADASGVVANVTAVTPDADSFVTVFPCGQPIPETSTLNHTAGSVVPNLVMTGLGGGAVCLYSPVTTDLLVDVAAYLPAGATGVTALAKPVRMVDTRRGLGIAGGVLGTSTATIAVGGVDPVPASATAAVVNITAVGVGVPGFVTAWPAGQPRPITSNANFRGDQVVANASVVPLGGGAMSFAANTAVDLVVDITGYMSGTTAFVPMTPFRLYDSRDGVDPPCSLAIAATPTGGLRFVDLGGTPGATLEGAANDASTRILGFDATCQHVYRVSDFGTLLSEFDRTGRVTRTWPGRVDHRFDGFVITDRGPLAIDRSTFASPEFRIDALVDPSTEATVVDFTRWPALGDGIGWSVLGVARDLSVVMFSRRSGNANELRVFDGDGNLLHTWVTPLGATRVSLSPYGRYISTNQVNTAANQRRTLRVWSLAGDLIAEVDDAAPEAIFGSGIWTSDGSMVLCGQAPGVTAYGATRWGLFTAPRDLPGLSGAGCLVAAG